MGRPLALTVVLVALGFAFIPTAVSSEENGKAGVSEYCASHGDFGLTHGACVAYFQTHNVAPHDASVCQEQWIQSFLGVSNHGQCVKRLREMRR